MQRRLIIRLVIIFSLLAVISEGCSVTRNRPTAGSFRRDVVTGKNGGMFQFLQRKPGAKNRTKVKESRAVVKAKREQAKRERKIIKEYNKAVKAAKKRHKAIQSKAVQDRMDENRKERVRRERERKKRERQAAREARKKYK